MTNASLDKLLEEITELTRKHDANIKNADVVSIGPNIYGAHTPEERMDIKSVGETWEWILKILENYNIKEE